jgi:hypothetical protein
MEILIGSNSPVKHKVYWKGIPTDADAVPTVRVYDVTEDPAVTPAINPGTLLTTWNAVKSETDIGVYEVYPAISYTTRNRQLKLEWVYSVEGTSVTKTHKLFVTTPYVDLAQAADALGIGSDMSDPNYKSYYDLTQAERWARKIIENYTGQQFYLYDGLHTVYGAGTDVLPLPFKLSEIHEVYQNDILIIDEINKVYNSVYPIMLSESGFGIRVDKSNMLDNTVYTANGMVPPTINDIGSGGAFGRGYTYRVAGRYGWEEVPDEVELATIELMKDYFSKDKAWRNKYLHSIQTFDWHFEYNQESYRGTGNVYVDQILLPYVINQMIVI